MGLLAILYFFVLVAQHFRGALTLFSLYAPGGKTCEFFHWVDETVQAKKLAAAQGEGDASDLF